jgi:hypothetical protein
LERYICHPDIFHKCTNLKEIALIGGLEIADIFLSYKNEDRPRAEIIARALEQQGFTVWWDPVIPPGRTFDEVIEEELKAAHCVIVLWSTESVRSKWIKTEATEGGRRGILIPILIDNVLPPLAFRMVEAAKLIDWDGTLPNSEFDLLLGSIARICGRSIPVRKEEPGVMEKSYLLNKKWIFKQPFEK